MRYGRPWGRVFVSGDGGFWRSAEPVAATLRLFWLLKPRIERSEGQGLSGLPHRAEDVVKDGAGHAVPGWSKDNCGVQTDPASSGLAMQVDGQVHIGKHPVLR